MKFIAHRGLIDGPDKFLENSINQIEMAIEKGFDVEVDVWYIENEFYLGHDSPLYKISGRFLKRSSVWAHAKNIEALIEMKTQGFHCFWHQNDDYTITSNGFIWTYPGKAIKYPCVLVMPEWQSLNFAGIDLTKCSAICSDYVADIRALM